MKLLIAITSTALIFLSGYGEKKPYKAVDQQMKDAEELHKQENGM
jgi:hypothetical protein